MLKALLHEFKRLTSEQENAESKKTFAALVHQAILGALKSLRDEGTFNDVPYIVIWLPDSGDAIMDRSVRELNAADVDAEYTSEFA